MSCAPADLLTPQRLAAYGLSWDTTMVLPGHSRLAQPRNGPADVMVRAGSVVSGMGRRVASQVWVQPGEVVVFELPRAGRIAVHGNDIRVCAGPDRELLGLMLAGPAMAEVLAQRGLIVIRGSAVETPRGAVMFVGPPAAGASTLAAALAQAGYPLLTDDLVAIRVDDRGEFWVAPGRELVQLAADVCRALNLPTAPLRAGSPRLWATPAATTTAESQLRAIYLMEHSNADDVAVIHNDAWEVGPRLMNRRWNPTVAAALRRAKRDRLVTSAIEVSTPTAKIRNSRTPMTAAKLAAIIARDLAKDTF